MTWLEKFDSWWWSPAEKSIEDMTSKELMEKMDRMHNKSRDGGYKGKERLYDAFVLVLMRMVTEKLHKEAGAKKKLVLKTEE